MAHKTQLLLTAAAMIGLSVSLPAHATLYQQTNLVSNGFVPAANIDAQLQAPWGVSFSPTGPFWVSDNADNLSTLYNSAGVKQGLVVSVDAPTGQVFNTDRTGFGIAGLSTPTNFIFAGSNGTISAWSSGTVASVLVNNAASGSSYNGLTQGTVGGATYLYAADTAKGVVSVFDSSYHAVSLAGSFKDPSLPGGFAPFNVRVLNGSLFVAYANFATNSGAVAEFDLNGNFIRQVAIGGTLNQSWALDIAPAGFGQYANDLLVGNLADGKINVFDPATSAFLGQLDGVNSQPLAETGLWTLVNGNGGNAGSVNSVYFAAEGASGVDGVLGSLTAVPEPGSVMLMLSALLGLGWIVRRKPSATADAALS